MRAIFIIFVLLIGNVCYAANPICSGKVTAVGLSANGGLSATIIGSGTNLSDVVMCNLDNANARFSTTACKSMQSLLMAAKATNEHVTLWLYESDFSSCTQSWGNLSSQGFYHLRAKKVNLEGV